MASNFRRQFWLSMTLPIRDQTKEQRQELQDPFRRSTHQRESQDVHQQSQVTCESHARLSEVQLGGNGQLRRFSTPRLTHECNLPWVAEPLYSEAVCKVRLHDPSLSPLNRRKVLEVKYFPWIFFSYPSSLTKKSSSREGKSETARIKWRLGINLGEKDLPSRVRCQRDAFTYRKRS